MTEPVKEIIERRQQDGERLAAEASDLFQGFNEMMKYYYKPSALTRRDKELIATAVSVAIRCVPCLAVHLKNAFDAGATRGQAIDAAAIGVEFGGGPSFVVVRENLLPMLDQIEAIQKAEK